MRHATAGSLCRASGNLKEHSMEYILIIFSFLLLAGCTDNNHAEQILRDNGYTDVSMTGYSFWACGQDDWYHSGFIAKSPNGRRVKGTVCSGIWFKNSTIRFE